MEFNRDQEFEKNQTNSSEMNENNESNEMEERVQAVDADFTIKSENVDFKPNQEEPLQPTIETTRATNQIPKKPATRYLKGFASTVAAGVIGSVLTLTILPHTDYLKNYDAANNQVTGVTNQASKVKTVSAQPSAVSNNSIADIVENMSKTIVGIVNYQQQQSFDYFGNTTNNSSQSVESGSGSGVIFQKSGNSAYIVTNNHVIEGATKLEVSLYNGETTSAKVVGSDALTDLAVLKIDSKYVTATAEFGDSTKMRPGDQVYAIGNPLGLDFSRSVTSGIISATDRTISVSTSAGSWDTNVIQTDAAINPGNSGGALINTQGQVVGINSLKIAESGVEGLGFAIPSSDFIPIVNQLISNGKIERPYLGIGLADLDQVPQVYWQNLPNNVTKGVLVMNVDSNSAAGRAGFQSKDVIVAMNGTKIESSSDLRKYLYTKVKIGDDVKFEVYRNGKQMTLTVKLTSSKTE
ncbi:S1C family serine protease [Bacillus sp. JJ1764]|uniref:S1C family serine protease n=1 Tax=Bacillus sp. JJ1764 TaxID=3122964 RepID=UPI003000F787